MRRKIKHLLTILIAAALLLSGVPAEASPPGGVKLVSNTGFTDVKRGDWYEEALLLIRNYYPGIIDGVTETTFEPERPVKRGEFLKMVMTAAQGYTADKRRNGIHWAGEYYTMALENNVLVADVYSGYAPMFVCSYNALEEEISRYEMAVILTNTCTNMLMESTVSTATAYANIKDYGSIEAKYLTAVEQAFGKGLLNGYDDGSFGGSRSLRRCEAATVIYRLLWSNRREMPSWALEPDVVTVGNTEFRGYKSFALWLQGERMYTWGADGRISFKEPARSLMFGEGTAAYERQYFASAAEAAPYMTSVVVPFWTIDASGQKVASKGYLTVHKLVAAEVEAIFEQIFNDPERFPVYGHSIGGGRFTGEVGRHALGCAIDINPTYNCECNFKTNNTLRVTTGSGWWPYGMGDMTWAGRDASAYHGRLSEASVYSINPYGSVVRAFADYGWGWGGSGTNVIGQGAGWGGTNYDFMHFSFLEGGG